MFIPLLIFLLFIMWVSKSSSKSVVKPTNKKPPEDGKIKPPQTIILNESFYESFKKIKKINHEYNFKNWKSEQINYFNELYSLSDLLIISTPNEIYYGNLLQTFEWKFKRLKVLIRDKYECADCKSRNSNNHVHHLFYLQDKLPWDIEDNGLLTLCYKCHIKRHENTRIPVYRIDGTLKILASYENPNCIRCGGSGYILIYKHVENGICFKCRGNLIRQTVFSNSLNLIYEDLNSYNDTLKRNEYINHIMSLDSYKIYNFLPDKSTYLINFNDDLPF